MKKRLREENKGRDRARRFDRTIPVLCVWPPPIRPLGLVIQKMKKMNVKRPLLLPDKKWKKSFLWLRTESGGSILHTTPIKQGC